MDKQYSVRFFTSLLEAVQKLCREYLDFDQCVDVSGYLALEIDNYKKERFVISELLHSTGDVISESYCTKAFKTQRKYVSNKTDDNSVLRERNSNYRLEDEQRTADMSLSSSRNMISPRNRYIHGRNVSSHTVVRGDQSSQSDQSAMSRNYYETATSSSEWTAQSLNPADSIETSAFTNKRSMPSSVDDSPSAKTLKTEDISIPQTLSSQYSSQDQSQLSSSQNNVDNTTDPATASSQSLFSDTVHLPAGSVKVKEELDDCVLIDSADEAEDRDLQLMLSADDSSSSMYDSSGLPLSFSPGGERFHGTSDQPGSSQQKQSLRKSQENMKANRPAFLKNYTTENLNSAIDSVMSRAMTIKEASSFYKIPKATLYNKLPRAMKEHVSLLTAAEEEALVASAIEKCKDGSLLSKGQFLYDVKMLLDALEKNDSGNLSEARRWKRFKNNLPDYSWLANFCKRNPEIMQCFPK